MADNDPTTTKPNYTECRECGEALTLPTDQTYGFHEECEEGYVYCDICRDFVRDESGAGCRHVQWVDGHGHTGCGYGGDGNPEPLEMKEGLHLYLSLTGDAPALLQALLNRSYWFQFQGPLIGSGCLHFEGAGAWRNHHDSVFSVLEDREEWNALDALKLAVAWLMSLWSEDDGCRAYELTIARMIGDWLAARPLFPLPEPAP